MNKLLIFLLLISSAFAQEDFGVKDKVERLVRDGVKKELAFEAIRRIGKYKKFQKSPKKYYDSINMSKKERDLFYKKFPEVLTHDLPHLLLSKTGMISLELGKNKAHFKFSDLKNRIVYLNDMEIHLPEVTSGDRSFLNYYNEFIKNMSKKETAYNNVINFLNPVEVSYANDGYDYMEIPDGDSVPHWRFEGEDKQDTTPSLYKRENRQMYNVRQTKQVLLASIIAISDELDLNPAINYYQKEDLPKNLAKIYNKIESMVNDCKSQRDKHNQFIEGSPIFNTLTALDRVNERINNIASYEKYSWWAELDEMVWSRTSVHFNASKTSYNICKNDRVNSYLTEKDKNSSAAKNLCENMDKLTTCLVELRSSDKVSNKFLTTDQMDLLIENPTGKDYGTDDVIKWIQEK